MCAGCTGIAQGIGTCSPNGSDTHAPTPTKGGSKGKQGLHSPADERHEARITRQIKEITRMAGRLTLETGSPASAVTLVKLSKPAPLGASVPQGGISQKG